MLLITFFFSFSVGLYFCTLNVRTTLTYGYIFSFGNCWLAIIVVIILNTMKLLDEVVLDYFALLSSLVCI